MRRVALFAAGLALTLSGPASADPALDAIVSDRGLDGFVKADMLPVPDQDMLARGQQVWGGLCQNCHGGNKATGAPKITSTKAWAPRIEQGMPTLIDHALNGFIGPKFTTMPPRGGNPDLSDEQVASAVAFMVWASGGADAALAYVSSYQE